MSIMIVATNKDINPWIESFKAYNPNIDIQIYPHIKNKEDITFALVWSKSAINYKEFPNLKCISSMGAGVDHILENTTIPSHIYITKVIDTKLVSSMWEYLLTAVMNVITNHYKYISFQKQTLWKPIEINNSIEDTRIAILGLGQLGATIAQNFYKMNFIVKGYSSSKKEMQGIKTFTKIEDCIEDAHILINLLPLTKDTQGILNYNLFSSLKKGCYMINVGRGEHLIVEDLLQAIKEQIISGATLDVFETEPLEKESPLWKNENIIITPHSASITNPHSVTQQIMTNYSIIQKEGLPHNIVDTKKGY